MASAHPVSFRESDNSSRGSGPRGRSPEGQCRDPEKKCGICCEALNRSTRRPVACPYCPSDACSSCVQRFLVTVDDPECMSCRRPWTPDAIDAMPLPRSFVLGDLKRRREHVLLQRERALLPATQAAVARDEERARMAERVRTLRWELDAAKRRLDLLRWREERRRHGVHFPEDDDGEGGGEGSAGGRPEGAGKRAFVKPCPADGCRGFLTTAYRCGLCEARVCPRCHDRLPGDGGGDAAHACDPAAVESVSSIKKDCRPCPKCGAMIHRITGCNQMFCTAPGCNTAFDWASLRILSHRHAHNPHLFEYQRRMALSEAAAGGGAGAAGQGLGQGQGEGQGEGGAAAACPGGAANFPSVSSLTRAVQASQTDKGHPCRAEVLQLLRFGAHLARHEMVAVYPAAPDVIDPAVNEDLRKRYLKNEVDEGRLSVLLQAREKARRKRDAIHQILSTVVEVVADLLRAVEVDAARARTNSAISGAGRSAAIDAACQRAVQQTIQVTEYANEALEAVAKRYSCKVPKIMRTDCTEYHARWLVSHK